MVADIFKLLNSVQSVILQSFRKDLVDIYHGDADIIRLVVDNLNIHTPSALSEVFEPQEACQIVQKLEFHYTPKHASWQNLRRD
ncbi:transposase [Nostoc sp.]|uniref:transposase n=1 Tax=Nostoc sp. TaxID=1180 RepID=UPI002FF6E30C